MTENRQTSKVKSQRTLEEVCRSHLDACDEPAEQIVLYEESSGSSLWIKAYGAGSFEVDSIIEETDTVRVNGKEYTLWFDADPYWPAERPGVVIYAHGELDDVEPVALEEGIEDARTYIEEATERGELTSLGDAEA